MAGSRRDERLRRGWDRLAPGYDSKVTTLERRFLEPSRPWLCQQATGVTLEVAIGTGMNLPHYPDHVALSAIEWSEPMLAQARARAAALGLQADLRLGDARSLPWPDGHFDTVVATFSLCSIPQPDVALEEMRRVLRPGGLLLLIDHIESSSWPIRWAQRVVDLITVPLQGERWCHRPLRKVAAMGFTLEAHDRLHLGLVERLAARAPA
jgi:ubiquinone/menaquinone biosynthesis C-methylase UbiE